MSSNETTGYIAAAAAIGGVVIKTVFDAWTNRKTMQITWGQEWRKDNEVLRAGIEKLETKIVSLETKIDHLTELKGQVEADRDRWRDEAQEWKSKSERQGKQIEEMRISLDTALRGQEVFIVTERERQRAAKESAASKPAGTPGDPISIIPAPNVIDPDG